MLWQKGDNAFLGLSHPPRSTAAQREEYQAAAACEGSLHNLLISTHNSKHTRTNVCVPICAAHASSILRL